MAEWLGKESFHFDIEVLIHFMECIHAVMLFGLGEHNQVLALSEVLLQLGELWALRISLSKIWGMCDTVST